MKKELLIIGFVWPEPNSTAAGSRMMQLINSFQENNYKITFVSTAAKNENSFPLEDLNIQTYDIELNDSGFDQLLNEINPDIVLFDRFLTEEQFGWRVSETCPKAMRILDTEDLHFLRNARFQAFKDQKKVSLDYLINTITKREVASIYRCDLSLIISKYEYELLVNTFKIDSSLLIYLPFLLDTLKNETIESYPTFNERKNFMTIGNFKHEPNWKTVNYLKNTIWPLIRCKLPKAELHLYGAYATEKVLQLNNVKEGFIIKGRANSIQEVFTRSRVCLAPLQFGAGLKGKLIEAMQYGTPSITTSIGAEAMHDQMAWNGFITDDPVEFANRAIEIYQNKELWFEAQQNGIAIINHCFPKEKYQNLLLSTIHSIQKTIENHRNHNFIGAMLMHHTLQSTKYLSKWIEEKNK
ncbi:MAG: glycosyltransferase [Bacteroidota bacterium]